jgi:hypothetical protein
MRAFAATDSSRYLKIGRRNVIRRPWIVNGMVVASFFIYALAALIVCTDQRNDFIPERSSIAAAVSNVFYGAPLGKVYSGILAGLLEFNVPLDRTLVEAARQDVPRGDLLGSTMDGNGIGYIVVSSLSMRLFGPHTSSLVFSMLVVMGISALVLVWRFRDGRSVVAILYFTSLTVMLFTPLVWNQSYALNMAIGGIRYFSLAAILPGLHLLLECADTRASGLDKFVAMGVQVAVLVLAVLVRNSAAPVIFAVGLGCLIFAWKHRREPGGITPLVPNAIYMMMVAVTLVGLLMLWVPRGHLQAGRFSETVWHRIFVSLGMSPAWPFGNVRELYDCKRYIPEGLVPGTEDRNGNCIWWDYAIKHNIPIDAAVQMTYGQAYDTALREAFFNVARLYPGDTFRAFLYYKPPSIFRSIKESSDLRLADAPPALLWLLIASLGTFIAFALIAAPISKSSDMMTIAGSTVLLAVFSAIPYLAVWAMPHTSGDLLFYCFFGLGLGGAAFIKKSIACHSRLQRRSTFR